MKSNIYKVWIIAAALLAGSIPANAAATLVSTEALWGEETVSLNEPVTELRPMTFYASQPATWTLYRKVLDTSVNAEIWHPVASTAAHESSWTTPSALWMSYMRPNYEALHLEQDGLRLTPFKIVADAEGVTGEIEFLWNVYPTAPKMDILSWNFDLDTENRECVNSEMELEIKCVGQEQYAIGYTRQQYFSMPDDMSDVRCSYFRFIPDGDVYNTTVNGQWGWILHVVAINHFGSTPGNYLLLNDYIDDPEKKAVIEKWNPNPITSIDTTEMESSGLFSLKHRTLHLSSAVAHAVLHDINGVGLLQWADAGTYDLSSLPAGFYILTLRDSQDRTVSHKISLR